MYPHMYVSIITIVPLVVTLHQVHLNTLKSINAFIQALTIALSLWLLKQVWGHTLWILPYSVCPYQQCRQHYPLISY